jgi:hypothetical protein
VATSYWRCTYCEKKQTLTLDVNVGLSLSKERFNPIRQVATRGSDKVVWLGVEDVFGTICEI